MQPTGLPPVQVYITVFLGIPDNPGILPGCKPQGYPKSKYPRIPGNTRQSQDYPGMQTKGLYLQSKYPRIPGNTRQSREYPGMQATGLPQVQVSKDSWEYQTVPGLSRDASHGATPSPSIPGFLGIPDSPGIIPGCKPQGYPQSKYPRILIPGCKPKGYTSSPSIPPQSICLSVSVCLSAFFFRCLGFILGFSIVVLENMNTTKLCKCIMPPCTTPSLAPSLLSPTPSHTGTCAHTPT